jgi:Helix-turn-helix domain
VVKKMGKGTPMKTLDLDQAAAFLHMHPEELRTRAKRGIIPGAKIGRCWVFIDADLAEFIRSQYPVRRQALPVRDFALETADRLRSQKEYEELMKPKPRRGGKKSG